MKRLAILLVLAGIWVPYAHASFRFYSNIHVTSPSGKFRLDAIGSKVKGDRPTPFPGVYTYTCVEVDTGRTIWMSTPPKQKSDPSTSTAVEDRKSHLHSSPPVDAYLSDGGWAAIVIDADYLVIVSPRGKECAGIDLYENGLTADEKEKYVDMTSVGPMWKEHSVWYFLPTPDGVTFVVRPWWGRRIFVDIPRGQLSTANEKLKASARKHEAQLVVETLKAEENSPHVTFSKNDAAYLAGILQVKQAIPELRKLEKVDEDDGSVGGGLAFEIELNDEVDPGSYSFNRTRQIAQEALRRLGESPKPLPCFTFQLYRGRSSIWYTPPKLEKPRHLAVDEVKAGISAKQVLSLIGTPDFVDFDIWSYDMGGAKPFSLTLTFDGARVSEIERGTPLWKSHIEFEKSLGR